jgi:LysM repeat protein
MIFSVRSSCGLLSLLALLALLTGCPQPEGISDEEREPHFMDGKRCENSMDYSGAIDQFEKAVEVNPRNASAHFELGVLYDQRDPKPARAIYHYDEYLRLKPKGAQAELATTHILACKQQLARTVSLGPVTQTMEAEYQKLNEQNKKLTEENKAVHDEIEKWKAFANRLQLALTNQVAAAAAAAVARPAPDPAPAQPVHTASPSPPVQAIASVEHPPSTPQRSSTPPPRTKRTHVVARGETFGIIARRYGVRVDALMAANPRIDSRHLHVGQTLIIP